MNREGRIRISKVNYRDEGCNLHPSCLNCPRDICFLEEDLDIRDRTFLAGYAQLLLLGYYDIRDGRLPFVKALEKIRQRMIELKQRSEAER